MGMGWFPDQPGGLNRYYFELLKTFQAQGLDLTGIVAGPASRLNTEDTVTRFGGSSTSLFMRMHKARKTIAETMKYRTYSVVTSHFAPYIFPALDMIDQPLVVHFQGPWAQESRIEGSGRAEALVKHLIERTVYQRADRCIVLSQAFADVLAHRYRVMPGKIAVIPGAVDIERFNTNMRQSEARTRLGLPLDRPIVVAVRRLANRMGLENLVKAMSLVHSQIPNTLLLIAGKGPLQQSLMDLIIESELLDSVRLLGFVPDGDLPLLYRAASLSIVPTLALEGFGLISIESLAAGTPVLVTPVGGLPEVVAGLAPQLVLPSTGPESLADGIVKALLGDIELPSSDACQAYVRSKFTWDISSQKVLAVYQDAIQHHSGR